MELLTDQAGDEEKPICARCINANFDCVGYGSDSTSSPSLHSINVVDLSREKSVFLQGSGCLELYTTSGSEEQHTWGCGGVGRSPNSIKRFDSTDGSASYFSVFLRHITQGQWCFYFSGFFSRILLEDSLQNECIRQSIMAIGALTCSISKTADSLQHGSLGHAQLKSYKALSNQHYQASLGYHASALTRFRDRIQTSSKVPHKWILSMTVLLVIYELLQGEFEAADGLLNCGYMVLDDALTMVHGAQVFGPQRTLGSDVPSLDEFLAFFASPTTYSQHLTSKWAPILFIRRDSLFSLLGMDLDAALNKPPNWSEFHAFAKEYLSQPCDLSIGGDKLLAGCSNN
ncbi:Zn(2)-C6 fungal-type domain-containing protein [Fusarium falciforme]|uniref:Zn(2)-C6 fungal-type domain-containing protein n=1 Tax=Fusarium falciforme TaxID=195108 RepID=UPI0023009843|nr:Zn(2)-C6 fungal-type domain-containing protein [Fusarium falciforme]WAO84726.1 Zn(2)-C6 fungal-type domain-containing protein [Fusarium falciforme]